MLKLFLLFNLIPAKYLKKAGTGACLPLCYISSSFNKTRCLRTEETNCLSLQNVFPHCLIWEFTEDFELCANNKQ